MHPGRILALAALCSVGLLIAGGLAFWRLDVAMRAERVTIDESRADERRARDLLIALINAETGQRGYLLTGREFYLHPIELAEALARDALDGLARGAADAEARAGIARMRSLVDEKLSELRSTVAAARAGDRATALGEVQGDQGKVLMDAIRREVDLVFERERVEVEAGFARLNVLREERNQVALAVGLLATVGLLACAMALAHGARRLQRMQAVLRGALEHMRDGLVAVGPDGVIRACNARMAEIAGYPASLCREGGRWALLVAHDAGLEAPLLGEKSGAVVRRGNRVLELWRAATEDGGEILLVADITRRDAAEVTARRAQRMEAMGQLTGGLAHDFNNLLQVIGSNLDLAMRDATEALRPRLEAARSGVDRGARLTQHLLAFARRQPLAPRPTDPNRLVARLSELLHRTLGGGIELQTVLAAGAWPILVDPVQLESAVLNLAINGRDAMPQGGKLTIEVANVTMDAAYAGQADIPPGDYVMVAVSDTGTGMPAHILARAFEPFFTTKSDGRGTGLGLAMVYGFARQSGGFARIYSEPGKGTTVKLFLPRAEGDPVEAAAMPDPPAALKARVLVVEDDPAVRAATVAVLQDLGAEVDAAEGPEMALARLAATPFDLLFTDVVMPGDVPIREFVARARAARPGIAVLYTSGYTQNGVVHGGRLDPGVRLLNKPYGRADLARAAAAALADARSGRRLTVLLVEDEALVRMATAELLAGEGHSVHEAGSVAEAEAIDTVSPDILVADIELPDGDGVALARKLRARFPSLGVIIASGRRPQPLPANITWLDKPYDLPQLRAAIRAALSRAAEGA
jgi:signal transduction histidine kinase/DNA-binding response OmpR family regulator